VFLAFKTVLQSRNDLRLRSTDPKPGGRIYLAWNDGYYMAGNIPNEKDRSVAFTWSGRGEPAPTQVQVELASQAGGTVLKLVHSGLGSGEAWNKSQEEFDRGWKYGLENFTHVLEKGPDLRIVRRPMLGITMDADEETARN
jgi:hypothetical protein